MFWRLFGTFLASTGLAVLATVALIPRSDSAAFRWIVITVFVIGVSLLPALVIARKIGRPLNRLTESAQKISRGNYGLTVLSDASGEIRLLADAFSEMSRRLEAQFAQLEHDRHRLRAILSGMIEGVIAMDHDQRILFANRRAAALLGFDAEDAVGRRFWELVRQPRLHDMLEHALNTDRPAREELNLFGPGVRSIAVYAARLPQADADPGALLVLNDITELRRLERIRQDFVANASHELKTPLTVITAAGETLLDGAVEDPRARQPLLEQIAEQSARLDELILDMLRLSRAESGALDMDIRPIPVATAVGDCVDRHRPVANARRQRLIVEPPSESLAFLADEQAVGQILDNLVDNALKYTPEGGTIQVGWSTGESSVKLRVRDDGIGIPPRDLPRIFERFYRVDKGRSRKVGGTGLGLSIVKHLVQNLNGTIEVDSRVGAGTTFIVTLPLATDVTAADGA